MKTLVLTVFFFMGLVILGGCLALGPNNLSSYYKNTTVSAELYNGGKIVDLINFRIEEPKKKIVILFNHGTRSWRRVQACRPNNFGIVINTLNDREINNKKVMAFHLCSYSAGSYAGELTPIRAKEIQLAVSYFLKLGIEEKNIFVFGQSRGGWSTLYFAAKNTNRELGGYIVFAPAICGPRPLKCWDVIEEHIKLFKSATIDGILYSHAEDPFFSPREHQFTSKVQDLELRTGFCKNLTGSGAHGFYQKPCSGSLTKEVEKFISKRATAN